MTCQDSSLRYSPNRRLITPRLITLRLITCRLCLTSRNCTSPPVPTGRPRTQRDVYPLPSSYRHNTPEQDRAGTLPNSPTIPFSTAQCPTTRPPSPTPASTLHPSPTVQIDKPLLCFPSLSDPPHQLVSQPIKTTVPNSTVQVGTGRLHSSPHYTTRVLL